ncbi:sugar ABC transporter ATP-binding protein [Amycolatopsis thermalba]|uniref:Sugar ABC transporter ATP-binding protein n=1 Tax=Amycolatopsis thermalba TaxID=944492 RepID=A0ABY4NUP2_9PSEU|nr:MULTISPECIES: sugar ABC transporter ATP-binding protein [Amycolatopsis]OXM72611.1 ABC transporter ATP-binding protein [Amycolatopsis sp. KNN50.9b]UQS23768.1 sugar ABC transporter ATP-binding protein [Amycolatopsis thermalba]
MSQSLVDQLDIDPAGGGTLLVDMAKVTKTYRGVHAISEVDFDLRAGEVHALVGENGAGKSTLCKILAGAVQHSSGVVRIGGEEVSFRRPHEALDHGIAMVYQETSLVPTMTAAQNIELGHEKLLTRFRSLNIGAQQLLQSMNFHVDPTAYVSNLGAAKKQMVEIARALRTGARIVIFDEPTASLTPEETLHLFNVIEDLRTAGLGIIYVSHALEESLAIANRVTVLRDGKRVACLDAKQTSRDEIVKYMVGRSLDGAARNRPAAREGHVRRRRVLEVENLILGNVVKNMSFSAYAGEVLGIAGLIGSGRTETAKIITGALKRNRIHGGRVLLNGKPVRYRVPKQAIDDGIVYITEDRKLDGFFETMTVADNIYLGYLASRRGRRQWLLAGSQRRRVADEWSAKLRIKAINADAKIIELSGGNQQKVVVGKSLVAEPEVVIFDEPTRGVDVGAIDEIHHLIRTLADEGKAVIVISSYLPEILAVSDRILVTRFGRAVAEFSRAEATQEKIMYAAIY